LDRQINNPGDILKIQARQESLSTVSEYIERKFKAWNLPGYLMLRSILIAEEVITNIISYAYTNMEPGDIEFNYGYDGTSVIMTIGDYGLPFNPIDVPVPEVGSSIEHRKIGGLGLHLVLEMADDIQYIRKNNKNILLICIKPSGSNATANPVNGRK
jgi:serine/threonine-protein kinase RsbW